MSSKKPTKRVKPCQRWVKADKFDRSLHSIVMQINSQGDYIVRGIDLEGKFGSRYTNFAHPIVLGPDESYFSDDGSSEDEIVDDMRGWIVPASQREELKMFYKRMMHRRKKSTTTPASTTSKRIKKE